MAHRGRSNRIAILSEKERRLLEMARNRKMLVREREYLLSKSSLTAADKERIRKITSQLAMISRRLTALVKVLDKRLSFLADDLRTILKSQSLKSLVAVRSQYFNDITPVWWEIHAPIAGYNYGSWQVKQVRLARRSVYEPSEDTKKKVVLYWLDTNIARQLTIEDIYKPEYAIKGIKSKVWFRVISENRSGHKVRERYDVRAILKEAVELEFRHNHLIKQGHVPAVLPRTESKAVDIRKVKVAIAALKNSISDLHKIRGEVNL